MSAIPSLTLEEAEQVFLSLCRKYPQGLTDSVVEKEAPELSLEQRVDVINDLSKKSLLTFLRIGTLIAYKYQAPEESSKLFSLGVDERLVYQLIQQASNHGIWTRDLRLKSHLQQAHLTKILKTLEGRRMVKGVKSVESKNKKLYMLFELEPSRQVTGGVWYSEQEYDLEFIELISKHCFHYVWKRTSSECEARKEEVREIPLQSSVVKHECISSRISPPEIRAVTAQEVTRYVHDSTISKIELTTEDVEMILNVLVYENKLEKVSSEMFETGEAATIERTSSLSPTPRTSSRSLFRVTSSPLSASSMFAQMPCGQCPVIHMCAQNGPITPVKCPYFTQWLEM